MIDKFIQQLNQSIKFLDRNKIERLILEIINIKNKNGRIFFLGIGGSAGNASHAVNDFRKICNIECYSPTDNISEITARTNDDGFEKIFSMYLMNSKLSKNDAIFIFSVGGGNKKLKVSLGLIEAIKFAKQNKSKVFSIIGRKDGYAYKNSDIAILINVKNSQFTTPVSESMQAVIWHALVSDPRLKKNKTKW
jgi:D-sedoheptulose 7-phosphate isomerase